MNELGELRKILVQPEEVGEVLPDALKRKAGKDDRLAEATLPIVEENIRQSVQRNPRILAEALFPVIGNGLVSRFKVDATLADREWHWEAALPVADPQLDVFVGQADLQATLPGGGMLVIGGSRIPGEFVNWCRAGGNSPTVEGEEPEKEPEANSDRPAR